MRAPSAAAESEPRAQRDGGPLVGVGLGPAAGVVEAVVDGELDDVGLLRGDAALQAVQEEGMDPGCGFVVLTIS